MPPDEQTRLMHICPHCSCTKSIENERDLVHASCSDTRCALGTESKNRACADLAPTLVRDLQPVQSTAPGSLIKKMVILEKMLFETLVTDVGFLNKATRCIVRLFPPGVRPDYTLVPPRADSSDQDCGDCARLGVPQAPPRRSGTIAAQKHGMSFWGLAARTDFAATVEGDHL